MPLIGVTPMCLIMPEAKRPAWAVASLGVVLAWFVGPAALGHHRQAVGSLVLLLWLAQIVMAFTAPGAAAERPRARRARWLWWSLLPGGLTAWLLILAGIRARVWWVVLVQSRRSRRRVVAPSAASPMIRTPS